LEEEVTRSKNKKKHKFFLLQTQNHAFFHLEEWLFNRYAKLNLFSWLQGHKDLLILKIMRFILPFIFSLYYEWVWFFFYAYFIWVFIITIRVVSKSLLWQSIAKFDIKTEVVVYKLANQLRLIIMADLHY
jgi:hypothetical protein